MSDDDTFKYWRYCGQDGYDTMEWIATQPWSNGRVFMTGPSAMGNAVFAGGLYEPTWLMGATPTIATGFGHQTTFPGGAFHQSLVAYWLTALGKRYVIEDLGEVLEGDRLVSTPSQIKFLQDAADQELCAQNLTAQDLERLRYAVANDYYFQVRRAHAWGGVGGVHAVRGCAGPGPGAALAQRLLGAGPALPY